MNSVTICGTIGEPKFRAVGTKTGNREVASFGICQREGNDGNNNPNYAWYNCEYWLNEDSKLKQYLVKGARVLAIGELKTEKWTNKEGVAQTTIKIAVRGLELVGGKQEQPVVGASSVGTGAEDDDNDLPF